MGSDDVLRCMCSVLVEPGTLYTLDKKPETVPKRGLCFSHSEKEAREAARNARIAHIKNKYHLGTLDPKSKTVSRARQIASYDFEVAIANYALRTGNDKAPYIVVGSFLENMDLQSINSFEHTQMMSSDTSIYFTWNKIKDSFPNVVFSKKIGQESRLVMIADTKDIRGLAADVKHKIQRERNDILVYAGHSHMPCHKKVEGDIGTLIEEQYIAGLRQYLSEEQKKLRKTA